MGWSNDDGAEASLTAHALRDELNSRTTSTGARVFHQIFCVILWPFAAVVKITQSGGFLPKKNVRMLYINL